MLAWAIPESEILAEAIDQRRLSGSKSTARRECQPSADAEDTSTFPGGAGSLELEEPGDRMSA